MAMICPECDAMYYLFGDFIGAEGKLVRAGDTPIIACDRCLILARETGMDH